MAIGAPAADDIFTDNHRWGDMADWNRTAVELHGRGGIHRIERDGFSPFWALIDHATLKEVERDHTTFTNEPESVLGNIEAFEERQIEIKTLIHMDEPQHGEYRALTNDWFKPASVRRLDARLDELSREAVAKLEAGGGELDFAAEIAWPYPLQVILEVLGLPPEDYGRMMTLTQEMFGQEDPDLQRDEASPEVIAQVIGDFYQYFSGLTLERRGQPTDDLASLIANGRIGGEPMPDLETLGYYVIVASAGHDTTSATMADGMLQLIEHPEQLRMLQDDPTLMPNAVEEIIRLATPVRHFMRTAQADVELCGEQIAEGDWIYLSYKAANLDPKVFEDPLRFDITRANAKQQVAFGWGIHHCLGAQLARNEIRNLFSHLLPRLESVELAGPVTTMKTTFVGGPKTVPIRYTLR
ncbi:MAG: cytochrome P450 [Actinomycetota bacterium]